MNLLSLDFAAPHNSSATKEWWSVNLDFAGISSQDYLIHTVVQAIDFVWCCSVAVHQCTMCILGSMFSFQPNKPRHILKFVSWYIIQHIFVPACSVGRKTWFSRKPWLSNTKFGISESLWPILSVPKIMFPVPKYEMRNKFSSFQEHTECFFYWSAL